MALYWKAAVRVGVGGGLGGGRETGEMGKVAARGAGTVNPKQQRSSGRTAQAIRASAEKRLDKKTLDGPHCETKQI